MIQDALQTGETQSDADSDQEGRSNEVQKPVYKEGRQEVMETTSMGRVERFLNWAGDLSPAKILSAAYRLEVKYLTQIIAYERSERERERKAYENDRQSWEIERRRLEDRLLTRNGIPPVHAQINQQPSTPVNRKGSVAKAYEAKRGWLDEIHEMQARVDEARNMSAQQGNPEGKNGEPETKEFP